VYQSICSSVIKLTEVKKEVFLLYVEKMLSNEITSNSKWCECQIFDVLTIKGRMRKSINCSAMIEYLYFV